jgi:hypothetical protein
VDSAISKIPKGSKEVKPGGVQIIVSRWRIDSALTEDMYPRINTTAIGAVLPDP